MTQTQDPFVDPSPVPVNFASVESFRGRVVMIEPTDTEMVLNEDDGKLKERITATVTVLDGSGPVQTYSYQVPTGQTLQGPVYQGVWIGQQVLAGQLKTAEGHLHKRVLGIFETQKPGQRAMKGNAWGLLTCTPEQKQAAAAHLAQIQLASAQAPAQPAPAQAPQYVPQQPAPAQAPQYVPQQPAPAQPAPAQPAPAQPAPAQPAPAQPAPQYVPPQYVPPQYVPQPVAPAANPWG